MTVAVLCHARYGKTYIKLAQDARKLRESVAFKAKEQEGAENAVLKALKEMGIISHDANVTIVEIPLPSEPQQVP